MAKFNIGDEVYVKTVGAHLVCRVTEIVNEQQCKVVGVDYPDNEPMLISQSALEFAPKAGAERELASALAAVEGSYLDILNYSADQPFDLPVK